MNNPYQRATPYGISSPQGIYANVSDQDMGVPGLQGGFATQRSLAPQAGYPGGGVIPGVPVPQTQIQGGRELSFIENILRLNLGKTATLYMTYENNSQWNAKIFKGKLEAAGRDHIIISDTTTGMRILLLLVNLDYITFDQPLEYTYPYR